MRASAGWQLVHAVLLVGWPVTHETPRKAALRHAVAACDGSRLTLLAARARRLRRRATASPPSARPGMRVETVADGPRGPVGDRLPARPQRARHRAARPDPAAGGERRAPGRTGRHGGRQRAGRGRADGPRARPGVRGQRPRVPVLHDRRGAEAGALALRGRRDEPRGDARLRHRGRPDPRLGPDRLRPGRAALRRHGRRRRRRPRPGRRLAQRQVPAPDAEQYRGDGEVAPGDRLQGPPQPAGLRLGRADRLYLDRARARAAATARRASTRST